MNLYGKNLEFKRRNRSNPMVVITLMFLCVMSLFVLKAVLTDELVSPWLPTAVPTREAASFALEGESQFRAGNLERAIEAYGSAERLESDNPEYLWKQGRALAYLTASQTTDAEKAETLQRAVNLMEEGLVKYPEDSNVYAVLALVYLWYADADLCGPDLVEEYAAKAEDNIRRAVDYDSRNALAYAIYSEILYSDRKSVV